MEFSTFSYLIKKTKYLTITDLDTVKILNDVIYPLVYNEIPITKGNL